MSLPLCLLNDNKNIKGTGGTKESIMVRDTIRCYLSVVRDITKEESYKDEILP